MGSKSKSSSATITTGYRYYYAFQLGLCYGRIDNYWRVSFDNKPILFPRAPNGVYSANTPNLFGGDDLEGGFVGEVAFYDGSYTQSRDSYLVGKLGENVPAYRGLAHVVFRQPYIGTSPYVRNTSILLTRINYKSNGDAQWYPSKAKIFRGLTDEFKNYFVDEGSVVALWVALDKSPSMAGAKLDVMKSSVTSTLDSVFETFSELGVRLDVAINAWGGTADILTVRNVNSSTLVTLKNFVNAIVANGSATDFATAFNGLGTFINNTPQPRVVEAIFVSDGGPNPLSSVDVAESIISGLNVSVNAFGIVVDPLDFPYLERIDNVDGAENLEIDADQILGSLLASVTRSVNLPIQDMNPAHIIRECLTDSVWGKGFDESTINDATFEACADKLASEQFGISIVWRNETSINEFINLILRHIDAVLRQNNQSGDWELKLIRNDYNENTLLVLDEDSIIEISSFKKKEPAELINQVTIVYDDLDKSDTNSFTIQNLAAIEQYGGVIPSTVELLGISNATLASKVAYRELRSNSFEAYSATLRCTRKASQLNRGDVFKMNYTFNTSSGTIELQGVIMRVVTIDYGNLTENSVTINCVQDVFGDVQSVYTPQTETLWTDDSVVPQDLTHRIVIEAPYYELARKLGDTNAQALVVDTGYTAISAVAPQSGYFNYRVFTEVGSYQEYGSGDFSPFGITVGTIGITSKFVALENVQNLSLVENGSYAIINPNEDDEEIVFVDGLTDNNDGTWNFDFERGCLDTTRKPHSAGTKIFFCEAVFTTDGIEYEASETTNIKLIPVTGRGSLSLSRASVNTVTFDSRKERPYPPARLEINGTLWGASFTGDLEIDFVERNRLQQTAYVVNDEESTIAPEAGTTYSYEVYQSSGGVDGTLVSSGTGITATTITVNTFGSYTGDVSIYLWAVRDGYESYQKVKHICTRS